MSDKSEKIDEVGSDKSENIRELTNKIRENKGITSG